MDAETVRDLEVIIRATLRTRDYHKALRALHHTKELV
jgi:hypothetical protein